MKNIIALSGPRACGKSTIAGHLVAQHGYTRIAFADALRSVAKIAGDEYENDRIYLAQLGEELRELMPNFLLEVVKVKVESIDGPVVIEDVRFPSEKEFCDGIGATTIRLEIPEEVQLQRLQERDGKIGEEAAAMLACLDESILDDVAWDLKLEAFGDFKLLAAELHTFSQTGRLTLSETKSISLSSKFVGVSA
tara:strand:- start:375 stop:956 length:582 start_codon:yes stop_codon:yes gene_type:complete